MTRQPQPSQDWVAIIKSEIEASDDYRAACAFGADKRAAVQHFTDFLKDLQNKADRGEYVDPKAFEKEVRAYPDRISAPVIADILYQAFMEKRALMTLAEQLIVEGHKKINRDAAKAMDIAETRVQLWMQKRLEEQQERLTLLEKLQEEQDINLMRAVTFKEEAENYRFKWTLSPVQQYKNIRNIFKRHSLLKQAERAFHDYCPKTVRDITAEARQVQEETTREFEAEMDGLREAFDAAKAKITMLDHCDMDILDSRLRGAIDDCRDRFTLARFQILHKSNGLNR